jgi:hypothetical protein
MLKVHFDIDWSRLSKYCALLPFIALYVNGKVMIYDSTERPYPW